MKDFARSAPRIGRDAEHLAQKQIVIGQMFHPVPVSIEAQPDHPQHENLPQIHARTTRRLLARQDGALQKLENLQAQRRMAPNPLQAGQDREQFIAAVEGQDHVFDGEELEGRLGFKALAHGQV